ncbi:hypothetical protein Cgig2_032227 [Carnegiea gigantea]|uniref:Domain X domain-containing protein n=1 Tax=Carnegiea gigantea TaxID=171969 RepID=A0A9Q1GTZ8_9CARY|nr:hypothetical protein Cgig2_032227 [Carnegiea gigantea]
MEIVQDGAQVESIDSFLKGKGSRQCHFSLWSPPRRIYINRLSKHFLDFMGFFSSVRLNSLVVRSQMVENSFLVDNPIKKFDTIFRIIPLVGSLAKAQFYNVLGHPISKLVWTDLLDYNIIDRFGRICRVALQEKRYILRLSCARTLARKHESTVRTFFEKIRFRIFRRILYRGRKKRRESESLWGRFYNWITSSENCLYIGWFGVLMIPTLLNATSLFIIAFITAPPVDIDGIHEPVSGSLLYGNNIISGAIIPTSAAIGLHFYPIREAASVDE